MGRRKKTDEIEPSGHRCFWAGCQVAGDYKAPKPGGAPRDYQWFCKDHITQFNKSWNFFAGMSETEIYRFQKESYLGNREEAWRVRGSTAEMYGRMDHAINQMFGLSPASGASLASHALPRETRDALSVLNLDHPCEKDEVKQQYRDLVKKYHPDLNGGNSTAADMFRSINEAYHHLMAHYCVA